MLAGCSNNTNTTVSQSVYELAWLPDGSGMLAYIDKVSLSALDGSEIDGQNLYHVGSDGSVGNSINPADAAPNVYGYPPLISISADGSSAITSFANSNGVPNVDRADFAGNTVTQLIPGTNLLGVSPDQKYVATTVSAANNTSKLLVVYDLTGSPPRLPEQTIPGAVSNRVLWTDNSHFAVTIYDSLGSDQIPWYHVTIFNVDGSVSRVIPNASVPLHASAYAPKSGELFVQTHTLGIDKINVTTGIRSNVITNDTVYSMDVSSDGTLLVYSSEAASTNGSFPGYAVNVANGHRTSLASSMLVPILSPDEKHVAFIHQLSGGESSDIQVVGVSMPQ